MVDVIGFEGLYKVTKEGLVYRKNKLTPLVINYSTIYPSVHLCKNNIKYLKSIHKLIADHYIPNPEKKPEVNHINGNKSDFSFNNLEWATRSENALHSFRTGLQKITEEAKINTSKRFSGSNHYNHKKVIRKSDNKIYNTIRQAAYDNGIPIQTLHRHLHNNYNCLFSFL